VSVTKEIIRLEKSNIRLNLTIPKEEVVSQYQDMIKDYTKNVQIPGFRRGKVPQEVLERKFGEALKGEALGKIIEKTIGEVFDDESLPKDERPLPYSYPEMEDKPQLDFDQDLHFSLVYDVMPKIAVNQWKGLEVEVSEAEVTEEDIARDLEEVRERNAFVLDRDDEAQARNGDIATVNYCELGENGEALPGTEREDFVFTLGSKNNTYQMDDDIVGMKKGETKEFTKTAPKDEGSTPSNDGSPSNDGIDAEKTTKLRVTLTALKEKQLPDLDDELAQDVDEKYQTLDDLKNSIRTRLEKSLSLRIKDLKINKLLEKIMENTPVVLPESMVKAELDGRLRGLARRFGVDTNAILRMMGENKESHDSFMQNWRPQAEKALHSRLIVETLIEEQNIEVSDEEIAQEMEKIAADTNEELEKVKKRYEEDNASEYLKDSIREYKFLDMLLALNTIKAGPKLKYLDLMENNG
jgi:trigger factor